MKKLTETDLEKGLDALQEAASKNNPHLRQATLLAKAQDGTIADEEKEELIKSIDGSKLTSEVLAGFQSETIQKSIDVSDFLRDSTAGVTQGLEALTQHIQKSQSDDHGFRIALATTLASMTDVIKSQGELLKSMSEQFGEVAALPARGPKSQGVRAQPMNKSFAGAPARQLGVASVESDLSKSEILDGMEGMLHKGVEVVEGEDLLKAISKYESSNQISPTLLREVSAYVVKNHAA